MIQTVIGDWFLLAVPSSKGSHNYEVAIRGDGATLECECSCPDYEYRGADRPCKHILEVISSMTEMVRAHVGSEVESVHERLAMLREHAGVIKSTVMPEGCSNAQVSMFLLVAASLGLDPLRGELWAFGKPSGGIQIMPGVEGYIRRAQSHPNYGGLTYGIVRKGDHFKVDFAGGTIEHSSDGFNTGEIIGSWARAIRTDQDVPVVIVVPIVEAERRKRDGTLCETWDKQRGPMIAKESLKRACRIAYGIVIDAGSSVSSQTKLSRDVDEDEDAYVISQAAPKIDEDGNVLDGEIVEEHTEGADPGGTAPDAEVSQQVNEDQSRKESAVAVPDIQPNPPSETPPTEAPRSSISEKAGRNPTDCPFSKSDFSEDEWDMLILRARRNKIMGSTDNAKAQNLIGLIWAAGYDLAVSIYALTANSESVKTVLAKVNRPVEAQADEHDPMA